jgi:hypothetical protein
VTAKRSARREAMRYLLFLLVVACGWAQDTLQVKGPLDIYQGYSMYVQLRITFAGTRDHVYFTSVTTPSGVSWTPICTAGSGPDGDQCWGTSQRYQYNNNYAIIRTNIKYSAAADAPTGDFNSTITITTNNATLTATVPIHVLPAPSPMTVAPLLAFTPIPGLARWRSTMTSVGTPLCPPPGADSGYFTWGTEALASNSPNAPKASWYYDGARVFYQIGDFTGDPKWAACGERVAAAYRDHVLAGGENSHAWHMFAQGLYMAHERTGAASYKDALDYLNDLGPGTYPYYGGVYGGMTWGRYANEVSDEAPESGLRELSYVAQVYVWDAKLNGNAPHRHLQRAIDLLIGHMDVLAVTHDWAFHQLFYDGLAMNALIDYFEWKRDTDPAHQDWRIPVVIKAMLDWIWTNGYDQKAHKLIYNPDPPGPTCRASGDPIADCQSTASILNNLVAPAFAWYWRLTGDNAYRDRGDDLFAHGLDTEIWSSKEFNQNYRWSFDYVRWRMDPRLRQFRIPCLAPCRLR